MAFSAGKGPSSGDKLLAILNGPNDVDDDEAILRSTTRAQEQLRRTSLYGKGARFSIPKIKRKKLNPKSPFVSANFNEDNGPAKEKSAVPPGAHDEQYRIVQYQTKANLADADRVWYATTSIRDGLHNIAQPPWYFGNQNKTKPADNSMLTAATRYGYRGSKEIRQFHTEAYEPRDRTTTAHTPAFLRPKADYVNEWVPPLSSGVPTTKTAGPMFMSPKMWPKTAEFVNGYTYKEREVTSPQYVRQSTAGDRRRPRAPDTVAALAARRAAEDDDLIALAKHEISDDYLSKPKAAMQTFRREWADTLDANATGMLKSTMMRNPEPFEAHKLVDETDSMKYSGSTAFIVRSQSTDELRFKMQMERTRETTPYTLRWRQVMAQFKYFKLRLKREQVMETAIMSMGVKLQQDAKATGQPTILSRFQFMKTMHKIPFFEHAQAKQMSLLYSVYDPLKKNMFRYVELLVAFTILDCEKESALTKLTKIWRLNETFGNDRSVMEMALTCLVSCCASDADKAAIEDEFKTSFRTACYQSVILKHEAPTASENSKVETTAQPAYNICDNFLNQKTFVSTLREMCPTLLELFDDQMSSLLTEYYGKDVRRVSSEESTTGDLSFILKK